MTSSTYPLTNAQWEAYPIPAARGLEPNYVELRTARHRQFTNPNGCESTNEMNATMYLSQMIIALSDGDYEDAIGCSTAALQQEPECIPAMLVAHVLFDAMPKSFAPLGPHPRPVIKINRQNTRFKSWRLLSMKSAKIHDTTMGEMLLTILWAIHVDPNVGLATNLATRGICTYGDVLLMMILVTMTNQLSLIHLARKAAESGHCSAAYLVGSYYEILGNSKCRGVTSTENDEFVTARKWYTLAANNGHTPAMVTLGTHYITGACGTSKNVEVGVKFLEKVAGSPEAQRIIGTCECLGDGIPVDIQRGLARLEVASEYGDSVAPVILGELYYHQLAPEFRDAVTAFKWYHMAATKYETAHAMTMVAELYFRKVAGEENANENAFKMAKKAADMGDPAAMAILGAFYSYGVGTVVDEFKAKKMFTKAGDSRKLSVIEMAMWAREWYTTATSLRPK